VFAGADTGSVLAVTNVPGVAGCPDDAPSGSARDGRGHRLGVARARSLLLPIHGT